MADLGKGLLEKLADNDENVAAIMKVGTATYNALQNANKVVTEKKQRVDESVSISMSSTNFVKHDNVHYFGIDVIPKNKTTQPWKVWHRYSEFRELSKVLGPVTTTFVDAPFPSRSLMSISDDEIDERRRALELWLTAVVDHVDSKGPWYEELRNFLEPDSITAVRNKVSIALPNDAGYSKDNTHFFEIVATPKDGAQPWTVRRRYGEFLAFKDSIGAEGDKIDHVPLPGKVWFMDEKKLDDRRKALEVWLQTVVAHPDSETVWAPRLRDFLDPQFHERRNRTERLVAERAKEREEEDLEDLRVDAALDHLFAEMGGDKVLDGVKEALITSMMRAVEVCSAPGAFQSDSSIKIPLPGELGVVVAAARKIPGLGSITDSFVGQIVNQMNEAAAKSIPQTVDVFKTLIQKMKVSDIKNLWMSRKKNACTRYLKRTSFEDMKKAMLEVCQKSLEENELMKYWADFVVQVKPIPVLGSLIESYDIQEYVVEMALNGLFVKMAIEEEKIRRNPVARTSDLMAQVFSNFR
jgi:hypothetical protein